MSVTRELRRRFRVEQSLPPAMAAGVTDRLWSVSDIVTVLEDLEGLKAS